jgi:hypothetical protein
MERISSHIEQVLKRESMKNETGSPQKQIPLTDQQRILSTDIREILSGRTVIYDDRETFRR